MALKFRQQTFGLLNPNALSALAFEHVDDGPGIRSHHRSDMRELFRAEMAALAGLVLYTSNPLSPI